MTVTAPPVLPYAGTAGYSGSETSEAQARQEAEDGTVKARQEACLRLLAARGARGVTVAEMRTTTGLHHGKASSVLSTLHHDGLISRLTERRERCAVYVLPSYVEGRETAAHGREKPADPVADQVDALLREWLARDDEGWSRAGRDPRGLVVALREVTGYGAT